MFQIWCAVAQNLAIDYYFQRKFDRFVSTRLGGIFGASVLAKATRSRETCVILKLSGSHYPSHEPGQAPNDPYGALRAAEGQSRLKWRRRRHRCSVQMVGRVDRCIRAGRLCTLEPQHQPRSNDRTRLARSIDTAQHSRKDCNRSVGRKLANKYSASAVTRLALPLAPGPRK